MPKQRVFLDNRGYFWTLSRHLTVIHALENQYDKNTPKHKQNRVCYDFPDDHVIHKLDSQTMNCKADGNAGKQNCGKIFFHYQYVFHLYLFFYKITKYFQKHKTNYLKTCTPPQDCLTAKPCLHSQNRRLSHCENPNDN